MAGYQISAVADRIQKMDFEANAWKTYTALCALAVIRGTARKTLENKVFGQGKPSEAFRQSWSIGQALYSNGMTDGQRKVVGDKSIDDAIAFTIERLHDHMTLLGATGKNSYREVMTYETREALDSARAQAEADAMAEADAEAERVAALAAEAAANEDAEAAEPTEPGDMDWASYVAGLSDDDLLALSAAINDELTARTAKVQTA